MKKSVIISIGIIYIVAIIVVGLFGQKMRIYAPIVYADKVVCNSENYVEYGEDNPSLEADGYIREKFVEKGMKIELKCQALPNDVSNKSLDYLYDDKNNSKFTLTVNNDYTASITINKPVSFILTVKASDGKGAQLKIKIIVYERPIF